MIAILQSLPEPLPTTIALLVGAVVGLVVYLGITAIAHMIGRRR